MRLLTPRFIQAHKRPLLAALLLLTAGCARAQFFGAAAEIKYVTVDPAGACVPRYITINTGTGDVYGCVNSVWTLLLGGGGGSLWQRDGATRNLWPKTAGDDIGSTSATNNANGSWNNGVGYNAAGVVTSGSGNSAIGHNALGANTTGNANTAAGSNSLDHNTTGRNNVGMGAYSLDINTTGSDNAGLGTNVLKNTTGNGNTAAGHHAGEWQESGENGTFLGNGAGPSAGQGAHSFNTSVGAMSRADCDNCVVLGRGKDGNGDPLDTVKIPGGALDIDGKTPVLKDASGNVSIGTMLPVKGDGADAFYTWAGPGVEPSALSSDANAFGPNGEKVSGDTMSYAELIALWDWFTTPANIPGWTVTKTAIGLDQSGTYQMYYYSFSRATNYSGNTDRTMFLLTGQHASEWGPTFAAWRMWFNVAKGKLKLPDHVRYIVIPSGNPWGFSQTPRQHNNSRNVDINRNYPQYWSVEPSADKGSAALSEGETNRIVSVIQTPALKPFTFLDLHSAPGNTNCSYSAELPYVDMLPTHEPSLRIAKALNAPYHATCFTYLGTESASVNWANSIRINSISMELGIKDGAEGSGIWIAEYETWLANMVLAYSRPDANPIQNVMETSSFQQVVDLASVASGACSDDNLWSAGGVAVLGDACIVSSSSPPSTGTFFTCRITTNTAGGGGRWQYCNMSGAPVDRTSATYFVRTIR